MAEGVGHYGVFNGSRFRKEIAPRIRKFIAGIDAASQASEAAQAERSGSPGARLRPTGPRRAVGQAGRRGDARTKRA